jgi:organic radical activating enzyme
MKTPGIRILGNIDQRFPCEIKEHKGRVFFTADADIDADGANGQNGKKPAYQKDNLGSEALANGGMRRIGGRVICAHEWARDIVATHHLDQRCDVLFSPSKSELAPRDLADWIVADRLPVRFQMQLHKLLWNDEPGR